MMIDLRKWLLGSLIKQTDNIYLVPFQQNLSLGAASAWGGGLPASASHWASEGAWGNAARQNSTANSSASNGAGSLGFWDDAIISSKRATKPR